MKLVFSLILYFNFSISYYRYVETKADVFFSGRDNCREKIKESIDGAKKTIVFALYYLSDKVLIDSLINASKRGVKVEGIVDSDFLSRDVNKKAISNLKKNFKIKVIKKKSGIMHHKFAIIDDNLIITGSYNWTYSANNRNNENLVIMKNRDLVTKYLKEFKRIKLGL